MDLLRPAWIGPLRRLEIGRQLEPDARGFVISCDDGKVVFLCWKYGETQIAHYHDVDSGFSSRKPIEGAVKARLYN